MTRTTRRTFGKAVAGSAAAVSTGFHSPAIITAQESTPDLGPYEEARIDWRQAEGESIAVLMTPAHYFAKFQAVTADVFTPLTGIEVNVEVIPPEGTP